MNSAGKLTDTDTQLQPEKAKRAPFSGLFLGLLGLFIIAAAILTFQLAPILYSVIVPPVPPVPESVTELNHREIGYGVDEWTYESAQFPCEIMEFYELKGADCPAIPYCRQNKDYSTHEFYGRTAAVCTGTQGFSMFVMRWIATISSDDTGNTGSVFQLSREIFWGGQIPPSMDELIEKIEQEAITTQSP